MRISKIRSLTAIGALACVLAVGEASRAGDPGELFPNVAPYDETVASPISRPEVKKAPPAQVAPTPVAPPTPAPAPAPEPPKVEPVSPPVPVRPPEPDVSTEPIPPGPDIHNPLVRRRPPRGPATLPGALMPAPVLPPLVEYTPYRELLMQPMVSPADAQAFAEGYADPITEALAGTPEQRKKIAELLESSAQSVASPELKRYVLLHAFGLDVRAGIPSAEREKKAQALLPLLTDKTLPVMQARADALNDLYGTFSNSPTDTFLDLYVDAHAKLTRYRVQAGFPNEAQDSLKKAREAASHFLKKPQTRIDELNEAAAWADRAKAASKLAPNYEAKLKANPDDPLVNSVIATLYISLYGDLEHAMPFAAKSNRKDLKDLAAVLKDNPPRSLSKDSAKHAEQILAIGKALVDVAKATSPTFAFDRYSIACFAGDHVSQVIDDGVMPASKILEAKILLADAKDIIDKTYLKRGNDLPKWLGGTGGGTGDTDGAVAKHTLGTAADFLKGLPKELAPLNVGWTRNQINQINAWMAKNHDDQMFDGQVLIEQVNPPMNGPDGKAFVPVSFVLPNIQLQDGLWLKTFIDVRMSPAMAARAKDLGYEQAVRVQGTIHSVHLSEYSNFPGEPHVVSLFVVVLNKE